MQGEADAIRGACCTSCSVRGRGKSCPGCRDQRRYSTSTRSPCMCLSLVWQTNCSAQMLGSDACQLPEEVDCNMYRFVP